MDRPFSPQTATARFIAFRYLFAHKRYNVINIVSWVAVGAICIVTMALVSILSIYNGYEEMILAKVSDIDPPLLLREKDGKVFDLTDSKLQPILTHPQITHNAGILRTKGLLLHNGGQLVVQLQGIAPSFASVCKTNNWRTNGEMVIEQGLFNVGAAISMALQLPPRGTDTLSVIVPKREGFINPTIPASSFLSTQGKVASVILSENEVYDNTLFMDLQQLQQLLNYTPSQVDGVALRISRGNVKKTRQQLQQLLPNHYILLDRSEQQPEITRLVAIEKWISFLILFFVLLLAAFNVVACVSMLMIEKQFDTLTLRALGASPSSVTNIFRYEGLLITAIGAGMGLLLGLLLCYSQMELSWITTQSSLGPQPYPVKIKLFDLAATLTAILGIGYLAAAYPAKVLSNKYYK